MFPLLFKPLKLGSLTLKNRLVFPAFNLAYAPDGAINERLLTFYQKRAQGGAGLIIVGGMAVSSVGRGGKMIGVYDDEFLPGLTKLAGVIKEGGATPCAQLFHGGAYAKSKTIGQQAVAPSPLLSSYTREMPKALSTHEVEAVVAEFVAAAVRAQAAGFLLVELIASAGYLLSQFSSPKTNHRSDRYGVHRELFLLDIISGIKKACGQDFPIIIRLSGQEFIPHGNGPEAVQQLAKMAETAGADALSVTGGWHESTIPQITYHLPSGAYSYLAAGIKEQVSIPVFGANRINSPGVAENLLAQQVCDAVCIGRGHFTDPDFGNKARDGDAALIKPCIGCGQKCTDHVFAGLSVGCALNPEVGAETAYPKRVLNRKVLVVGGGVAGCEAAIRLSQSGCQVTLVDKENRLGGHLAVGYKNPSRHVFTEYLAYLNATLKSLGVQVVTNQQVDELAIQYYNPDILVLGVGSQEKTVALGKRFTGNILSPSELWGQPYKGGKNVVVLGGGALGCEVALYLAEQSALSPEEAAFFLKYGVEEPGWVKNRLTTTRRRITILEQKEQVGHGLGIGTRWITRNALKQYQVQLETGVESIEATGGTLTFYQKGKPHTVVADTILVATGLEATPCSLPDFFPKERTFIIGDATRPSGFGQGIQDAYELVEKIARLTP